MAAKSGTKKVTRSTARAGAGRGPRPAAATRRRKASPVAARGRARVRADRRQRHRPESLRLREVEVGFTVADLDRSIEWYGTVLGFTPGQRFERDGVLRGVELLAGKVHVYLSQDDWKKGRDRVKGQGFRVYFTTVQDVDAIAARARAAGVALDGEPHDQPWGTREVDVTDLDGFKITIAAER